MYNNTILSYDTKVAMCTVNIPMFAYYNFLIAPAAKRPHLAGQVPGGGYSVATCHSQLRQVRERNFEFCKKIIALVHIYGNVHRILYIQHKTTFLSRHAGENRTSATRTTAHNSQLSVMKPSLGNGGRRRGNTYRSPPPPLGTTLRHVRVKHGRC